MLIFEITTSIDCAENQNGRPVEKLLVSGGGSYSQDTLEFPEPSVESISE